VLFNIDSNKEPQVRIEPTPSLIANRPTMLSTVGWYTGLFSDFRVALGAFTLYVAV
jgi:hypothetical protein